MEGFYSKQEAARVLGVSVRQIGNYLQEEKLSRVLQGRKAWIPQRDVLRLYDRAKRGPMLGPEDIQRLMDRVDNLESQVETLKLGLGFGSKRAPRTEDELLLLRQTFVDALSKEAWNRQRMSQTADELMKLQAEEVGLLAEACGPTAWIPLADLSYRMLQYIETHQDYPARGFDVLETRIIRSRDRFFGLVYAATKVDMGVNRQTIERVYESIQVPANSIEKHIAEYLAS